MSLAKILGTVGFVGKILLTLLRRNDPKLQDWVQKKKAVQWAEKYILYDSELQELTSKEKLTKKEIRRVSYIKSRKKLYRKWFFESN